jgi:rSAM/selenodomain-associated transferase 1
VKRAGLVVFARAPRPGKVKTRLTPPLTPEQASALYRAMLEDVLELSARAAEQLGLDLVLAVEPGAAALELAGLAPPGLRAVAQRGPDLSARLEWAVSEAAAGGLGPVLVRGSDSPALGIETLAAALADLGSADLVIAPDRDGGYSLVGLRRPVHGLFSHPMSTGSVLRDTLASAKRLGQRTSLLPTGFDLDTVGDLRWLAEARDESPDLPCPRLLRLLDSGGLWSLSGRTNGSD